MTTSNSVRKLLEQRPREAIRLLVTEQLAPNSTSALEPVLENMEELINRKNQLTQAQKRLSREIGDKKQHKQDSSHLISDMQILSKQLKTAVQAIKLLADEAIELTGLNSDAVSPEENPDTRDIPLHFRAVPKEHSCSTSELEIITNCHEQQWQNYILQNERATIYHDYRWTSLITRLFGHQCFTLAATDSAGKIHGVLPITRLNSRLFGNFIVSMPYVNYGGPLAENDHVESLLLDKAATLAANAECSHAEFRECNPRMNRAVRTDKISMVLKLPSSPDQFLKNIGKKIRAELKRPLQYNATFSTGGAENIDHFYDVFSRRMRNLGTPVYSRKFFQTILETFPNESEIAVVLVNNRPVAAGFLLKYRDTVEILWAASIENDKHPSVNMFLYGNIIKKSIQWGYTFFDFGRSTIDGPTYRFKSQWGTQPLPLYWHYWMRDGDEPPKLNPDNPKFRMAISIWKKLPVWLTKLVGPSIVKNLP